MDFGDAIKALRSGNCARRRDWKPSRWLQCVFEQQWARGYIELKECSDKWIPWVPNHADMLADDWEIFAPSERHGGGGAT